MFGQAVDVDIEEGLRESPFELCVEEGIWMGVLEVVEGDVAMENVGEDERGGTVAYVPQKNPIGPVSPVCLGMRTSLRPLGQRQQQDLCKPTAETTNQYQDGQYRIRRLRCSNQTRSGTSLTNNDGVRRRWRDSSHGRRLGGAWTCFGGLDVGGCWGNPVACELPVAEDETMKSNA